MCYENIEKSLFKLPLKYRCPQSFIFYGKNYNERKRISKEFALKILNTEVKNLRDMIEFKVDKKIISVEDIRALNMELIKKPEISKNKVILIYEADKMTDKAQNSFLKSLEDSIENIFIILIVNDIKKMIDTLVSRCLLVKFGRISFLEYEKIFKDKEIKKQELRDLYLQTKGDIDVTNFILEEGYVYKIYLHIIKLFKYLNEGFLVDIFEIGNEINNYKDYVGVFLEIFFEILRDIFIYKEINNVELICNKYFKDHIVKISKNISMYKIYNILKFLDEFRSRINLNLNIEVCYKIFILKVVEG